MRKWLQTCLIQQVKVSHHRDRGDNKHALSSCMTTPSVWQCAGAQPAVIGFLTKLLIVWMLPSCSDTLFSCSRICLFHKCFWHMRKRCAGLSACAKSILKVCCRRGKSSNTRNILFRRGEQRDTQHTQTHTELKVTAFPWWKERETLSLWVWKVKRQQRAAWAASYYCVTRSSLPEMIHTFYFLKPSLSLEFLQRAKNS